MNTKQIEAVKIFHEAVRFLEKCDHRYPAALLKAGLVLLQDGFDEASGPVVPADHR